MMPQVSPTRITVGVSEDRDVPIRKKNIHFQWEFPRCLTSICDSDQSEDEEDMAEFHQEFRDRLEVYIYLHITIYLSILFDCEDLSYIARKPIF